MDAHVVQLHQPISHQPQLIHTWEVMALACLVLAHKAQVNATEIKWNFNFLIIGNMYSNES